MACVHIYRHQRSLGLHRGRARCVPKSCGYHPPHLPPTLKSLLRNCISLASVTRRTLIQHLWSHDWSDWKVRREEGHATDYYQQDGIHHWKCNWWFRLAFEGSDSYCGILAWQIYSHASACQFQSLLNVIMPRMSMILLDVWLMNSIPFVPMRNALLREKPNLNCIWCDMLLPSFCWWIAIMYAMYAWHCRYWQEDE